MFPSRILPRGERSLAVWMLRENGVTGKIQTFQFDIARMPAKWSIHASMTGPSTCRRVSEGDSKARSELVLQPI